MLNGFKSRNGHNNWTFKIFIYCYCFVVFSCGFFSFFFFSPDYNFLGVLLLYRKSLKIYFKKNVSNCVIIIKKIRNLFAQKVITSGFCEGWENISILLHKYFIIVIIMAFPPAEVKVRLKYLYPRVSVDVRVCVCV